MHEEQQERNQVREAIDQADPLAAEELLPLVYAELRRLAAAQMARQSPGQTLQPTALVHEAWLKLVGGVPQQWTGRKHFFSVAAEAMRQILIDRARRKLAQRHGGGAERVDLDSVDIASPAPDNKLLELNEALNELTALQPVKAEVVKLRFFAGLTQKEIADLLGITERTVQRYWSYSQVWLFEYMTEKGGLR